MPTDSTNWTWIHGKGYDLTNFDHPGGAVAISMAKGRDATSLFESYHPLSERARLVLASLPLAPQAVKPTDVDTSRLTWPESSKGKPSTTFTEDLRQLLREHLEKYKHEFGGGRYQNATKTALLALHLPFIFYFLWLMVQGWWIGVFLFPLTLYSFNINTFHDASHFSLSPFWRFNRAICYTAPWATGAFSWDFQHVIGHHNHCNTEDDPDTRHRQRPKGFRRFWWLKFLLSMMLLQMYIDTFAWARMCFHHTKMLPHISKARRLAHFILRPSWYVFSFTWPMIVGGPYMTGHKVWMFPIIVWFIFGALVSLVTQLSHMQDDCESPKGPTSWHEHQVWTSVNYGKGKWHWLVYWFSGGLGLQIEHHLFPGINHSQLPRLQPGVEALCKKHGLPYRYMTGLWEPFLAHHAHMSREKSVKAA